MMAWLRSKIHLSQSTWTSTNTRALHVTSLSSVCAVETVMLHGQTHLRRLEEITGKMSKRLFFL